MSDGYQVSVDQLQGTVARLRAIADDLEHPKSDARYDTTIAPGVLGQNLASANDLMVSHNAMGLWLESMIGNLQALIDTYGSQTKHAADTYSENETQTRQDLFAAGH